MSDTPRTDTVLASYWNPWPRLRDLARELERELNAANATIRQQQLLEEENMRLKAQVIGPSELIDDLEIQRGSIAKLLEAQQRGTRTDESMLCEMLEKLLEEKETNP